MDERPQIGMEIRAISNLIRRRMIRYAPPEGEGATDLHGMIIDYLYTNRDGAEIFQRDIETRFSIRRSTASGILRLMEQKGIIVREPVSYDARLKKLVLTKKAAGMREEFNTMIAETEALMMKNISDRELKSFFSVVEKMKKNLEEEA